MGRPLLKYDQVAAWCDSTDQKMTKLHSEWLVSNRTFYSGMKLLTGNSRLVNDGGKHNIQQMEVECPCCHKTRFVRATLLNPANKNCMQSTLCASCNNRTTQVFREIETGVSETYVNGYQVLLDTDDVPKLQGMSIQVQTRYGHPYAVAVTFIDNKRRTQQISRLVLGVTNPKIMVDHINHNTLDDTKQNLREVKPVQNSANTGIKNTNQTGFKNIHLCARDTKWVVQCKSYNITKRFQLFPEAYRFWKENVQRRQGEHAYSLLQDSTIHKQIAGLIIDDIANGPGIGCTIFLQGCSHHCESCQSPHTWDFDGGAQFTQQSWDSIVDYCRAKPYIDHLTLSGGDPLDSLTLTNFIVSEFKYMFPTKSIWVYTGYTYEEIANEKRFWPLLETVDVLVDGPFQKDLKDLSLAWRGSSNQRVIDVQKTIVNGGNVVLWEGTT